MADPDRTDPSAPATPSRSEGPVVGTQVPPPETAIVSRTADRAERGDRKAPPTSTELSERARRQRRRERDARAERWALMIVVGASVSIGVILWVGLGLWGSESPPPAAPEVAAPPEAPSPAGSSPAVPSPSPTEGTAALPPQRLSSFEEPVDLPALRALRHEGLTIAAEGLPEVLTDQAGPVTERWAAELTCRFAYGVWEFSPNRRFRFLTTCGALDGETLVGAYEVKGTELRLSSLLLGDAHLSTTFFVERPSRLRTEVVVTSGARPIARYHVRQRVTAMSPGLDADGFFRTFSRKNHLGIPRKTPRTPASPASPRDPLLDLLKGDP